MNNQLGKFIRGRFTCGRVLDSLISGVIVTSSLYFTHVYLPKHLPKQEVKQELSQEAIRYELEEDPHKFSIPKPKSDNPHHYIPSSN